MENVEGQQMSNIIENAVICFSLLAASILLADWAFGCLGGIV